MPLCTELSHFSVSRLAACWSAVVLLAGCVTSPAPVATPVQPAPAPAPVVVMVPAPVAPPASDPSDAASRRLLAFHEKLRQMPAADLAQEVARLNALQGPDASPGVVIELAMALAQNRAAGELARAVVLLDPIARSSMPEWQPWQPWARLLHARLLEQRRLEEQFDRQNAQLRDSQRNVQQLNEKLEALKAIERSLTARPAAASSPAPVPAPKGP